MQPGSEPLQLTEPGQISPCPRQCLLDSVAGEFRVPEDEADASVESDQGVTDEHGRRVMIASPCSHDQLLLLDGRPWC